VQLSHEAFSGLHATVLYRTRSLGLNHFEKGRPCQAHRDSQEGEFHPVACPSIDDRVLKGGELGKSKTGKAESHGGPEL
jgi:hypothetical protein